MDSATVFKMEGKSTLSKSCIAFQSVSLDGSFLSFRSISGLTMLQMFSMGSKCEESAGHFIKDSIFNPNKDMTPLPYLAAYGGAFS